MEKIPKATWIIRTFLFVITMGLGIFLKFAYQERKESIQESIERDAFEPRENEIVKYYIEYYDDTGERIFFLRRYHPRHLTAE